MTPMERHLLRATVILSLLLCTLRLYAEPEPQWASERATLSYHMSHLLLPDFDGVSHEASGKGSCHEGLCDFLITAPVRSFSSGDSGRDQQMVEAAHGERFPLIVIYARFPESEMNAAWIHAYLEVQFAGQTAHYNQITFQRTGQGNAMRITGSIPLTCSDFKIERPTFLTVPIRNEIPVRVDMIWHPR